MYQNFNCLILLSTSSGKRKQIIKCKVSRHIFQNKASLFSEMTLMIIGKLYTRTGKINFLYVYGSSRSRVGQFISP